MLSIGVSTPALILDRLTIGIYLLVRTAAIINDGFFLPIHPQNLDIPLTRQPVMDLGDTKYHPCGSLTGDYTAGMPDGAGGGTMLTSEIVLKCFITIINRLHQPSTIKQLTHPPTGPSVSMGVIVRVCIKRALSRTPRSPAWSWSASVSAGWRFRARRPGIGTD